MRLKELIGNSYYQAPHIPNSIFATILELYNYFDSWVFPDDPDRILYASNEFSFRQRVSSQNKNSENNLTIQNLNLPFMNFYLNGVNASTERTWKGSQYEKWGTMHWDIEKKLRLTPMQLDFEATFFCSTASDQHYFIEKALWQDSDETVIYPLLEIEGETIKNIGLVVFNFSFSPQYNESDWLEQNNIRAVSFDFTVDTFSINPTTSNFWIPKTVLISFAQTRNLAIHDWDDYDLLLEGVIDHIEKEVTL